MARSHNQNERRLTALVIPLACVLAVSLIPAFAQQSAQSSVFATKSALSIKGEKKPAR
jgi:hypothetical protein